MTLAVNDAAAYTQCLPLHRKLILTATVQKISEISFKVMYIQKKEK